MPVTHQLDAVHFGIQAIHDADGALQAVVLAFEDPPRHEKTIVPFNPDAWENFKRHVAADGNVSPIAIAKHLNGGPRMDVPRG
jgi:hypothetical protein